MPMPLDARGMKKVYISPYVSFGIILLVGIGATMLIVHAISQVNFEFVSENSGS